MTSTTVLDTPESVEQAHGLVDRLEEVLEHEFNALKVQDLDQFELLLGEKNHLLSELGRLTGVQRRLRGLAGSEVGDGQVDVDVRVRRIHGTRLLVDLDRAVGIARFEIRPA